MQQQAITIESIIIQVHPSNTQFNIQLSQANDLFPTHLTETQSEIMNKRLCIGTGGIAWAMTPSRTYSHTKFFQVG